LLQDGASQHLSRIAQLIVEKRRANNRRLYLNSPAIVAGIRSYLAAAGVNVAQEVSDGSLVLSSDAGRWWMAF
jgi:hypothetical protein